VPSSVVWRQGRKPGYPRFKGKGQYDSITYPQFGFALGENSVHLSRIGTLKAILHRPVEGTIKTCTVRRQSDKWFVCFSCEVEPDPMPENTEQVGVDVGLEKFAALSNGEFVENPRFSSEKTRRLLRRRNGNSIRSSTSIAVKRVRRRRRLSLASMSASATVAMISFIKCRDNW